MNEAHEERASPFACVMDAIEPEKRQRHIDTSRRLFNSVKEIKELPDGYAFQLPDESDTLMLIAEFISLERLCCPFFGFRLEVEAEGRSVWLQLTGREGVKPFIQAEIGELMNWAAALPISPLRRDSDGMS